MTTPKKPTPLATAPTTDAPVLDAEPTDAASDVRPTGPADANFVPAKKVEETLGTHPVKPTPAKKKTPQGDDAPASER